MSIKWGTDHPSRQIASHKLLNTYSLLLWLLTTTLSLITESVLIKWSWIRTYHLGEFPRRKWCPTFLSIFCFTNSPLLFPKSGSKVALLAYPPLRIVWVVVVVSRLGLEDRKSVGKWLSYLFTLLVIIQPHVTDFRLFIFPSHSV